MLIISKKTSEGTSFLWSLRKHSGNFVAELGKKCDHKVAVALTNFIGSCFDKCFAKVPHSRCLYTHAGPGMLRRGGGHGSPERERLERGLLFVGSVAHQSGRQSGSESSEGQPGFGLHGPGSSSASRYGVRILQGNAKQEGSKWLKMLVWPILKIN